MQNVQIFENPIFGSVRTVNTDNGIYFVAKDVCDCLEIKNNYN